MIPLALQTAGEVARARYFSGMRLVWLLVVVLLVLAIAYMVKRLMR